MSEWVHGVEDLGVFRRAYKLSLEVHRISLAFPRIEQFALADQIRRASKSICANVDLRQPGRRVRPATAIKAGVPSLCHDGAGLGR
jgi:hypothetical protein